MQVVSFMNMKGGVGKTTLAVNVAYCLAYSNRKKVLVVDGDPQFNATQYLLESDVYLKHVQNERKGTLRDIFVPKRPGSISTNANFMLAVFHRDKLARFQTEDRRIILQTIPRRGRNVWTNT